MTGIRALPASFLEPADAPDGAQHSAKPSWSRRSGGESSIQRRKEAALSFLAYEWTFLRVFWAMLVFFAFLIFVWLVVTVLWDNFTRHDHSGWAKAGWTVLVIFLPLIGVLLYMILRPSTADRPCLAAVD